MGNNKQIVFFDIDGTLISEGGNVRQETIEAVDQLREKGIYPAIATGRGPFMHKHIREQLNINTYVSFNGQLAVFEGEVVYENPLQTKLLQSLSKDALAKGNPVAFIGKDMMTVSEEGHAYISESLGSLNISYPEVDLTFFEKEKIYQALVFCVEDEQKRYEQEHSFFDYIRWHKYSMDVLPKDGSKALGIQKLIERVGVEQENTFAFGDGLNDREMLQYVGTGIAMGNAKDEVKRYADYVTKHVDELGVVYGLRKFGLI
ncbi:Cof-type HAD-IIB family hydrolase [Salirhabdus salicampi]|uniref:Cof-type HAD-IIB family hydrolase n=1 Tax=Salirhabdus salicampi TaxID=476102 RepID=UPI0020C4A8C3|nr:Cof-type HAD-IIB family hydrolase [Salirhabdus salicampi]MCP8616058.1 Cof-type HAD-IIB family hydrolase [Salirhabdus salicampi]